MTTEERRYWVKSLAEVAAFMHKCDDGFIASIRRTADHGGIIYTIGNGGGQAIAEHWAAHEQVGQWVPAVASAPLLSALANDYGLADAYRRALAGAQTKDLLLGFTVGGSEDVLNALEAFPGDAICFSGHDCRDGTWRLHYRVDSTDPRIVEDAWSVLGHALVERLQ